MEIKTSDIHRDYLDLEAPAFIAFQGRDSGEFQFDLVKGDLNCRYSEK